MTAGYAPNSSAPIVHSFSGSGSGTGSGLLVSGASSPGGSSASHAGFFNLSLPTGSLGYAAGALRPPSPSGMSNSGYSDGPSLSGNSLAASASAHANVAGGPPFERAELHKSLKSIEALLVSLDEYRDLAARLAKAEKKVAKAAAEVAKGKMTREVPGECE